MLADPLTVAASFATTPSIPAISREQNKSVYSKVVGSAKYTLTISHQDVKGRRRTMCRVDQSLIKADPYVTGNNVEDTTSAYFVIDRSTRLTTDAEVLTVIKELLGMLATSTYANLTDTRLTAIVGGES